ncbi:MAG: class I fructose-bisphosphate aldolase family protein [Desulfobacterales bacterium]|nr:class I fructose-bisphosphate aldolase family protein [Desulfobacterales bacterium]MCP4161913.1 class I fructose-bisphosphate aldolase family protein [Deltaproteobacteria bacterium]
MNIGKEIRLERILNRHNGKTVIIPMDHGATTGPLYGLNNMKELVGNVAEGGANAVIGHMGLVKTGHRKRGNDLGLIVHLSAASMLSPKSNRKVLVNTVENAVKSGADGISIHVNVGDDDEALMLEDFGKVAEKCNEWGMPLLAMVYPRGPKVEDEYDLESVCIAARVGSELGADLVKTNYTGDPDSFAKVVEGCQVPVVIAGGSKLNDKEILYSIEGAMIAGAKGISIGRNAFQHKDPKSFVKAACSIVHDGQTAEYAYDLLLSEMEQ